VVASLPELMSEATCERLMAGGVVPILGLDEAILAAEAAAMVGALAQMPICLPGDTREAQMVSEAVARAAFAAQGLDVPTAISGSNPGNLQMALAFFWC